MSQKSLKKMLSAWEKSCEKPASTPLPERFYDVRKRPTGRKIYSEGGMTPEGEALHCEKMGLGDKNAKPLEPAD